MPVGPIADPTIRVKPSLELIDFIKDHVTATSQAPDSVLEIKRSPKDKEILLRSEDLKWLNKFLVEFRSRSPEKKVYLHELLARSRLVLPEPEITPRDPVLEARIQKLQAQQDARDYNAMTKDVDSVRRKIPDDSMASIMKEMNRNLIAVGAFVVTVAAAFVFGFVGIEYGIGPQDTGFKLLLGIICALIVALAEIYFLAKEINGDYLPAVPPPPSASQSQTARVLGKPHQE